MTRDFWTDFGAALDMGTLRIPTPAGGLSGSVARLRVGIIGHPALIELLSSAPPDPPALFAWAPGVDMCTLRCDLSDSVVAQLGGPGTWSYQVHIITAQDQPVPVEGASGRITVRRAIDAPAPPSL